MQSKNGYRTHKGTFVIIQYKSIAIVSEIVEVFALRSVLLASICLSLLSSSFIILSFNTCPFSDFISGKSLVNCVHNFKLGFL